MERNLLYKKWKNEEEMAFIKGGNLSYLENRFQEEPPVPWDFEQVVGNYAKAELKVLDYRTYRKSARVPIPDNSYDVIVDKNGDHKLSDVYRILKAGGIYITEQTGSAGSMNLVEAILPAEGKASPVMDIEYQKRSFEKVGFQIVEAKKACQKVEFYDVAAFVWYVRAQELKNPRFTVDKYLDQLIEMQEIIENDEVLQGTIHKYLIIAKKGI